MKESMSTYPVTWRKLTAAVAYGKRMVFATALLVYCVVGSVRAAQAETSDRLNVLWITSVTRQQTLLIEQRSVAASNPDLLDSMRGQMVEWAVRFLQQPHDHPFLFGRRRLPASLAFLCTAQVF